MEGNQIIWWVRHPVPEPSRVAAAVGVHKSGERGMVRRSACCLLTTRAPIVSQGVV